jgi:hypothetical protein
MQEICLRNIGNHLPYYTVSDPEDRNMKNFKSPPKHSTERSEEKPADVSDSRNSYFPDGSRTRAVLKGLQLYREASRNCKFVIVL